MSQFHVSLIFCVSLAEHTGRRDDFPLGKFNTCCLATEFEQLKSDQKYFAVVSGR